MASARKGRRRRGALSDEDRALWQQVAATTTPLGGQKPAPEVTAEPPEFPARPLEPSRKLIGPVRTVRPNGRPALQTSVRFAPEVGPVGTPEPGLDGSTARRLRKGDRAPEARIDLHGMSAARAHAACLTFLADALARGLRLVLVITGKGGRRDPDDFYGRPGGVLRDALPGWLAASPVGREVVGIYQAHQRHGGSGAYYIYLKRRR